jgi:hypothetical protein
MRGSFRELKAAQDPRNYIEYSLDVAYDELDDSAIVDLLGSQTARLRSITNTAFVAEIVDGVIQVPEELAEGQDGLAVAAVRPHEAVEMSRDYWTQTESQKAKTLEIIEGWAPDESAESFYEKRVGERIDRQFNPGSVIVYGAHATSLAITGVFSERYLDTNFYRPPNNSLAIIKYRPLLVLDIKPGTKHANADSVAHALVHARQIEDNPLVALESQTSFDLPALREELEAYHVGATLAERRLSYVGKRAIESPSNDESFMQIIIENVRKENNTDPEDPYKPSATLAEILADLMDKTHTRLDFEATRRIIRRLEAETDD